MEGRKHEPGILRAWGRVHSIMRGGGQALFAQAGRGAGAGSGSEKITPRGRCTEFGASAVVE